MTTTTESTTEATTEATTESTAVQERRKLLYRNVAKAQQAVRKFENDLVAKKRQAKDKEILNAKLVKDAEKAKREKLRKNGILPPKPDSTGSKIWEICERLTEVFGQPTPSYELLQEATLNHGIRESTARSEYVRWKTYNGFKGRLTLKKTSEA